MLFVLCFRNISVQFLNDFLLILGTCLIMAHLDQQVPQPCLQLCHQLRSELNYPMFFKKKKKKLVKSWKKIVKSWKKSWNREKNSTKPAPDKLLNLGDWTHNYSKQKICADTPQWSQILFKVANLFFYFSTILDFTSFLTTLYD